MSGIFMAEIKRRTRESFIVSNRDETRERGERGWEGGDSERDREWKSETDREVKRGQRDREEKGE